MLEDRFLPSGLFDPFDPSEGLGPAEPADSPALFDTSTLPVSEGTAVAPPAVIAVANSPPASATPLLPPTPAPNPQVSQDQVLATALAVKSTPTAPAARPHTSPPQNPAGPDTANNYLYVADDQASGQVWRYGLSGGIWDGTWKLVAGGMSGKLPKNPIDMAWNGGMLYVVSKSSGEVLRYKSDGTFDKVFVTGLTGSTYGIAFGPSDGNVYLSNADINGSYILRFYGPGAANPGAPDPSAGHNGAIFATGGLLSGPEGFVMDSGNNVYVGNTGNSDVLKITSDGQTITELGKAVDSMRPVEVALGPPSNYGLYFTAEDGNNNSEVQKYDFTAQTVSVFVPKGTLTVATGLTWGGTSSNWYVSDLSAGKVISYSSANGNVVQNPFTIGTGNPLKSPWGLSIQ